MSIVSTKNTVLEDPNFYVNISIIAIVLDVQFKSISLLFKKIIIL